MEREIEAPLAAAWGARGASALTSTLLTSRVGVEGVDGVPPRLPFVWDGIIGETRDPYHEDENKLSSIPRNIGWLLGCIKSLPPVTDRVSL